MSGGSWRAVVKHYSARGAFSELVETNSTIKHSPDMNRKLQFTVGDTPVHWRTHRIMELCDYLTANVLEPLFVREGKRWERRFMDFFTFDNGCDPLEPTGTIQFTVPPMFAGREAELEAGICQELSKLRIRTAPFRYERRPILNTVERILIPIIENPTALCAPPDVNMSRTRGYLVLRDLLGYERVNGRYEFSAEDLVKRLASVTEDRIAACTASPVKSKEGVRRTPSPVSMKAIRRCLDEVRQFAQWAMNNGHPRLAAV